MLTCGVPTIVPGAADSCVTNHIANPDNVAMIPDYNQLIIGEDTGGHQNDLIWIWDFNTKALTRVASTPYGSETTSPYWYTVGDWNYMSFVVQHPYGESDQDKHEETIKIDGEKKKKCTSGEPLKCLARTLPASQNDRTSMLADLTRVCICS